MVKQKPSKQEQSNKSGQKQKIKTKIVKKQNCKNGPNAKM